MTKLWIAGALALTLVPAACESTDMAQIGTVLGQMGTQQGVGSGALSQFEVEAGLREALTVGTNIVAGQLGQSDGYFSDPKIRIPLPGTLGDLQRASSRFGFSQPFDDLQLKLNQAASDAIPEAKKLVIGAVQSITLDDAMGILRGGDTAATDFLRRKTETQLRSALTPYMNSALQSSGAFQSLNSLANQNGLGGLMGNLQNDVTTTAVNYGLDGLFLYVAAEEQKIRENPVARTTDILRRVFGSR